MTLILNTIWTNQYLKKYWRDLTTRDVYDLLPSRANPVANR